jgi:hypothetical protein
MLLRQSKSEHAPLLAAAVVSACAKDGWTDDFQLRLLRAVFRYVFHYDLDAETLPNVSITAVREVLSTQDQRAELIDLMVAMEVICNPIPVSLTDSVDAWARGLEIDHVGMRIARELALGSTAMASADFIRSTYTATANAQNPDFDRLLTAFGDRAINFTVEEDLALTKRYADLRECPPGSLGRELYDFYITRGFSFPGTIGAANTALAHHDWGHVIYDYGTTGIGEVEAAAFRAASSDYPGVGLQFFGDLMFCESAELASLVTGLHPRGEMNVENAECRVADAIRRGRVCTLDPYAEDLDFFDLVHEPLEELRARWNVVPKSIGIDCGCIPCQDKRRL